jgi:hypothetical protein
MRLHYNPTLINCYYYLMLIKKQVKAIHFMSMKNLIKTVRNRPSRSYLISNLSFFTFNIAFNPFFSLIEKYAQQVNLRYQPYLLILFL